MDLAQLEREALGELGQANTLVDLDSLYTKYLGRKEGELTKVLRNLGNLPAEEKKSLGQAANTLRNLLEEKFTSKKKDLSASSLTAQLEKEQIDVTLPGRSYSIGTSHPILETIREISAIFKQVGFDSVDGPEVETDENNFTALNIQENHPSRDLHDTFYLKGTPPRLLRTHTSPVQIRLMKAVPAPVRIIAPGRVYRHEAVDATHAAIFHQVEGLAVGKGVAFSDLKGILTYFAQKYFGSHQKVRFRPSYFPFVEPGAEMDLQCFVCGGAKKLENGNPCGLCKASGWIEMLGAGMVHPQVLRNVGYDPEKVSGYAFGMGVERIVMARLGVRDIRHFLESDLRFLEQFS